MGSGSWDTRSFVSYSTSIRDGVLRTVFKDGEMYHKETFEDIRERLNGGNKDE